MLSHERQSVRCMDEDVCRINSIKILTLNQLSIEINTWLVERPLATGLFKLFHKFRLSGARETAFCVSCVNLLRNYHCELSLVWRLSGS